MLWGATPDVPPAAITDQAEYFAHSQCNSLVKQGLDRDAMIGQSAGKGCYRPNYQIGGLHTASRRLGL